MIAAWDGKGQNFVELFFLLYFSLYYSGFFPNGLKVINIHTVFTIHTKHIPIV